MFDIPDRQEQDEKEFEEVWEKHHLDTYPEGGCWLCLGKSSDKNLAKHYWLASRRLLMERIREKESK